VGEGGTTLDVSTGLTYPAKAERARGNPKVALLYSDPVGSGLEEAPVALVQGLATVRDADLQANTDRYVCLSLAKLRAVYEGQPRFVLRSLTWYFARIWMEVTPMRILWWPLGHLGEPPRGWRAPAGTPAPPSDPAPALRASSAGSCYVEWGRGCVPNNSFLDGIDARKGRWRDGAAQAKGISHRELLDR